MIAVQFLPVVLSLLVLGAHFFRAGNMIMLTSVLLLLVLLGVRRVWAARIVQAGLVLGAVEWLRTLVSLVTLRAQAGEPFGRLAFILGAVALVTGLSTLIFRAARLREWYGSAPKGARRARGT